MTQKSVDSRPHLQDVLRRGDPATVDQALTSDERRAIQDRLARLALERPAHAYGWWRPRLAMGLALVALLVWIQWPRERSATTLPPPDQRAATHDDAVQQVRFITPNGTQIVWLLNTGR
jgi:hypothetical protein